MLTPMLANGLVMVQVQFIWTAALVAAGLVSIVALIVALVRPKAKAARNAALIALGIALVPFGVPLYYHAEIAKFSNVLFTESMTVFWQTVLNVSLSLLPLGIALLATYYSRKAPTGGPKS